MYPPHGGIQAPLGRIVRLFGILGDHLVVNDPISSASDDYSVGERQPYCAKRRNNSRQNTCHNHRPEINQIRRRRRADSYEQTICRFDHWLSNTQKKIEQTKTQDRAQGGDKRGLKQKKGENVY